MESNKDVSFHLLYFGMLSCVLLHITMKALLVKVTILSIFVTHCV